MLIVALSLICVVLMYNYYHTSSERNAAQEDIQLQVLKYQALEQEKRGIRIYNCSFFGRIIERVETRFVNTCIVTKDFFFNLQR